MYDTNANRLERLEFNSSEITTITKKKPDLLCFSHLRWDFVHQRPQHLLKRALKERRVFFFEEPIFDKGTMRLEVSDRGDGLFVAVPHLPQGLGSPIAVDAVLSGMVRRLLRDFGIRDYVLWYYTPMAISYTADLEPLGTIYDCMDELSAFKDAPRDLHEMEQDLFSRAELVFTGGQSLFEAKRDQHHSVHAFPSSIDAHHFNVARQPTTDPDDQKQIPHPRLGFFGVIDERLDIELLRDAARQRPDWQFVLVGPIVKIDQSILPRRSNIHYLGAKKYEELPSYIANWDVALMPFAINDATRFISPTKTPEYLAAGKPVVSTPIRDVVCPYGQQGLVEIVENTEEFIRAIEKCLRRGFDEKQRTRVDNFLSGNSWDATWTRMSKLIDAVVDSKQMRQPQLTKSAAQGAVFES